MSHPARPPAAVDHVVVGGGAAGCVVAARLSEDRARSVVLLEAGPVVAGAAAAVPARAPELQTGPYVDAGTAVPQPGLDGRAVAPLAGHGLGGGTAVNSMAWLQGEPADYDGWADGWSWSSMGPVLRAVEDHELGATDRHGAGGPMAVSTPRHVEPLTVAFLQACAARGLAVVDDLDGAPAGAPSPDRAGLVPSSIRAGRRWSVVDGYLGPAAARDNLTVRTGTRVTGLVLDGRRVVGVRTTAGEVRARRGVVLAAGALRTPQLLLLAGVGPAAHLRAVGVPVVVDLPGVGTGLRDHPLVPTLWPVADGPLLADAATHDPAGWYRLARRGPLSSLGQALALVRSAPDAPAPDLHLVLTPVLRGPGQATVAGVVGLLSPESVGSVRLADADPATPPVVDPGYLSHRADADRLRAGLRRLVDLFATDPLAGHLGAPTGLAADADDRALDAYVRGALVSYHHPVGTARMGTDPGAVVTPDLRVRGLAGLHVADASVFPTTVRANTQAPTVAVAERAAVLVRDL